MSPRANDERREPDVVRADGQQDQVELAVGPVLLRQRQRVLQPRKLRRAARGAGAGIGTFADPLRVEKSEIDRRPGAGERKEGHGDVRIFHRERERGAHLVAVERAVAGGVEPARVEPGPVGGGIAGGTRAQRGIARLVAAKAGAAGAEIFAERPAEKAAEAEALVIELDRPVGIALAGGDGIAKPRDQQIAYLHLRTRRAR